MSLRAVFSTLVEMSERVLRSAWNDLYFNEYSWSIEKAHRSALLALTAAAWRVGVDSLSDSISHLAHALSQACTQLRGISEGIVILDALRELASSIELRLILDPERLRLRRQDSLTSIEYAIKVRNSILSCDKEKTEARDYIGDLSRYAVESRATIIVTSNHRAIIISEKHENLAPIERVYEEAEKIPLGATPILLTPEEAYSLLSIPGIHEKTTQWRIIEDELHIGQTLPIKQDKHQ
ncbi:MAG: hypothetical protein F7C07_08475 [Desulfurococcales archaeon]|nr:hypothetical protein [Desulfurococcales archaeon]